MKLTTDQALEHAIAAHRAGKFEDAELLYRAILQSKPNHPDANHNLGVLTVALGKPLDALPFFKQELDANPRIEQFWLSYITALVEVERFSDAIQALTDAENSGISAETLDILKQHLPRKLLRANNKPEKRLSLSETRTKFAEKKNRKKRKRRGALLERKPSRVQINLLMEHYEANRLVEAETLAVSLTEEFPNDPFGWKAWGAILQQKGLMRESLVPLQRSVKLSPRDAGALSNMGVTLRALGKLSEAEACYRKAIAIQPDFPQAYTNLCGLLEHSNDIDGLLRVLGEAKTQAFGEAADFLYFEALAAFRSELYDEAKDLMSRVEKDEVSKERKGHFFKLQGDLHHYSKDYEAAFLAYASSNQTVKSGLEYRRLEGAANEYLNLQKRAARQLRQLSTETFRPEKRLSIAKEPTFLVGFPRSGTTLLDTLLRTHSKINVVEEQPLVSGMRTAIGDPHKITAIEKLEVATTKIANDAYTSELRKHLLLDDAPVVIDKLPLNILEAPLIRQVFPSAKFILALRHPLDCILSCWMQQFKLNAAMANMVDLQRIVDFYCVAMEIFHLSQKRYELNVHKVRYEDLVEDLQREVVSTLTFLGLEWEADLHNYQVTALSRERIKTPSHSQVIKPIYKTASYRWRHYEKQLEEFKPRLAPWLDEYGYEQ